MKSQCCGAHVWDLDCDDCETEGEDSNGNECRRCSGLGYISGWSECSVCGSTVCGDTFEEEY